MSRQAGPDCPQTLCPGMGESDCLYRLGPEEPALDWLEKGCEEHDGWMWTLSRDPWYDPLRNEPRFQALLKKIGPNK